MELQSNASDTLLSVREAAEYIGVSTATIWRKLGTKQGPRELGCYKIGARILISLERHIQPFLRRNEQNTISSELNGR
jgi:excisionase family DNA binding protein